MRTRLQLLTVWMVGVFILVSLLSVAAAEKLLLHVELRIPKSQAVDPTIRFAFATDEGMEAAGMSDAAEKEVGGFRIYEVSYRLEDEHPRQALIVYHRRSSQEPDQVFTFSIPAKRNAADWTDWKRPDYCETNAPSNFRFKYVPTDRTTNAPSNAFELRYRIE